MKKIIEYLGKNKDIKENKILLGEIRFSSDAEDRLKDKTKEIIGNIDKISEIGKLVLSLTLVQIARKAYNERNFWDNLAETLGFQEIQTTEQSRIGQIFLETIRKYHLFEIKNDTDRNIYVQNILAHSFIANEYLNDYFEFLYSFYNKLFSFWGEINNEEIETDIESLINYIRANNTDNFEIRNNTNSSFKSYKLLKSTRSVISQGNKLLVIRILKNHLNYLDTVLFNRDIKTNNSNDYFIQKLREWIEQKENDDEFKNNRKRKPISTEILRSRTPILCMKNCTPYICIPQLRLSSDILVCPIEIYVNGELKIKDNLDINNDFNLKITELKTIKLEDNWIFNELKIIINGRLTIIPSKLYRIFKESICDYFDSHYVDTIKSKQYTVLVSKDASTSLEDPVYTNSVWNEYYIWIDNYTQFSVNNTLISTNKNDLEINYDNRRSIFSITKAKKVALDEKLEKINFTFKHPIIELRQDDDFMNGNPTIECNGERKLLKEQKFELFQDEDGKNVIQINMSDISSSDEVGEYKVKLINSGEKILETNYLLLNEMSFSFDNHCLNEEGKIIFTYKGEYIKSLNENCKRINGKFEYKFIPNEENIIEFETEIAEKEYVIHLPINVFKYKFSVNDTWKYLFKKKDNYIYYEDIRFNNDLFVYIPNASDTELYWEKNPSSSINGTYDPQKGYFKFNISDSLKKFAMDNALKKINTINLYDDILHVRYRINNINKEVKIAHITNGPIINKIDSGFDNKENKGYLDIEIEQCLDRYECYATLIPINNRRTYTLTNSRYTTNPINRSATNSIIKIKLTNGRNYISSINSKNINQSYNIILKKTYREIIDNEDPFAESMPQEEVTIKKLYNVNFSNKLSLDENTNLKIEKIIYNNKDYELYYSHHVSVSHSIYNKYNTYCGGLFINDAHSRKVRPSFKINICPIEGNSDCVSIFLPDGNNIWYNYKEKILCEYNEGNCFCLSTKDTKYVVNGIRGKDYAIQTSRRFREY